MNPFIQIAHGLIGAALISLFLIWRSSFGQARHTLSLIGAIVIVVASGYILRTRFLRWGSRQVWLKYHQRFAALGLSLVLIHSAVHPLAWHSWTTFLLALFSLGTGVAVSLTARRTRRLLLRCHLALVPILLLGIVVHGKEKLDHDEFFPLTEAHATPCVTCHTPEMVLFHMDGRFQSDLEGGGTASEDLQWEFGNHDIPLSEKATVVVKQNGKRWLIIDNPNRQKYIVEKAEAQLNIHADSPYKAYTCLSCHVHNTPDIQFAHEVHGVNSYNACLNCHQTVIDGKTYGKRRANWNYNPEE